MAVKEKTLAIWQVNNCRGCKYADAGRVGSGKPCCTKLTGPEPEGAVCLARIPKRVSKSEALGGEWCRVTKDQGTAE